jgi:hypothetical protein
MLRLLHGVGSERKLRLFVVACCRRVPRLVREERYRGVLCIAERFAESAASETDLEETQNVLLREESQRMGRSGWNADHAIRALACGCSIRSLTNDGAFVVGLARRFAVVSRREENRFQRSLLKDIFGNPFRQVSIQLIWLTPIVTSLATAAYEERFLPSGELDSTRLAILADALEEAGCTDAAILEHLRSAGPHVRGCWAVDLLLGKE